MIAHPCPNCKGGLPGDVPAGQVCQCGSQWRPARPARTRSLQRRTPLSRGSVELNRGASPKRGTRLAPGRAPTRKTPIARPAYRPSDDPVTPEVRAIVLVRCGGLCEACGQPLAGSSIEFHHRWRRGHGDHSPGNIVALHRPCHRGAPNAVHVRDSERWAKDRGLILVRLPKDRRPADEPMILPTGRIVRLHPDRPEYRSAGDGLSYAV